MLSIKKVGIALAAFEPDEIFFLEQLRSIQSQNWTSWVCVISCDSPLDHLHTSQLFQNFLNDKRFVFLTNSVRLGHIKNFEKALSDVLKMEVDAVAFCDQDDRWYPHKLRASVQALEELGANGLVFSDMNILMPDGKIAAETAWQIERRGVNCLSSSDFLVRNVVPGTGLLMDVSLAKGWPSIPEESCFHDWWYALVASFKGTLKPLHEPLYCYRLHSKNVAGIRKYEGFIGGSDLRSGPHKIFQKCMGQWHKTRALTLACEREKLPVTTLQKIIFVKKWDLGLGLFILALVKAFKNPPLARALTARGIGKFLSLTGIIRDHRDQ